MFNLKDFTEYTNQPIQNKSVLCWEKKSGYFFLTASQYADTIGTQPKIVGVEE